MSNHKMAVFAITIITASTLTAPLLTEARGVSDIRSSLLERYLATQEVRTSEGSGRVEHSPSVGRQLHPRADEMVFSNRSYVTSTLEGKVKASQPEKNSSGKKEATNKPEAAVSEEVTDTTESTPPVTTISEPEGGPVVVAGETEDEVQDVVSADDFLFELAQEIHRLTNLEREQAGVPALAQDDALAQIANEHSEDMAENDYFSHTAIDGCDLTCRFKEARYDALAWGENIAWRSSTKLPEAKALAAFFVEGWMNSEGHRRNLLSNKFTHEGVGLAQVGNKVYATVNFADPR